MKIPTRITVKEIISSRYGDRPPSERHQRPSSWDLRVDGLDKILATSGEIVTLWSAGGQSPPQVGWTILLNGGDGTHGFRWTLYGMPSSLESPYKNIDELMEKGACVQVAPRDQ